MIAASVLVAGVVTGVMVIVGPAQAGKPAPPPDVGGCRQRFDGVWQDVEARPGSDIEACRALDIRKPTAFFTAKGDYARTSNGRVRMFREDGVPPPPPAPGSQKAADMRAASDFLTGHQVVDDAFLAAAKTELPSGAMDYLPAADPATSLERALRRGDLVEIEPLPTGQVPR